MFITFEGPDGSGKTTQSKLLAGYLKKQGKDVVWTREPGGTELGQKLRKILLDNKKIKVAKLTELFLFCADRAEHVAAVIQPALDAGKIVICDRYIDSTTAYQAGGRGFDPELIKNLNAYSTNNLRPDLTILIDVPVELGLQRATRKTTDKFEAEALEFHQRVRTKYLELSQAEPQRVSVFDGTAGIEEIFKQIKMLLPPDKLDIILSRSNR